MQTIFPGQDLVDRDLVDVALFDGVQRRTHLADRQRTVLLLLHQLGDALAALELRTRRRVEVRGELRERRELTVLGKRQTDRSEEQPYELQSLMRISYAVCCFTNKNHSRYP